MAELPAPTGRISRTSKDILSGALLPLRLLRRQRSMS
jgi:hypothetical protein